ncbi:MAG TPA: NepR family anti-sigma factor [Hyphomonas sp.]|nr:hypothetical protein [Hyphomonas sp.]MCB9961148.1 hypothetical protein [Hyphomonas sp.]HPE49405.1 NepR family anti-sigma factor [Hyphomonas sp.]
MARDDNKPGTGGMPVNLPGAERKSVSKALSAALRKTYDSVLSEPVPEHLTDLVAKIRAEEERRRKRDT